MYWSNDLRRSPTTASISRTHSQCQRRSSSLLPRRTADPVSSFLEKWWSQSGSNRRPQACKASALPTELWPHCEASAMVGRVGVEPTTSRLSGVRSNHLSYRPPCRADHKAAGGVSQLRLHSPREPIARLSKSVSRMKGHEDGGMFFGQEEKSVSYFCRHDP